MDEIQAELKVRRRLENIFNKQQDEFDSKKAYDDYLEMREEYIFNLAQNIDVVDTEGKIAEYQRINHENIIMNRARQMAARRKTTEGVLEMPSVPEESGTQAEAPTEAAMVYVPAASAAASVSAVPVPVHKDFSEDAEGKLVLSHRKKVPWRQVAAASGWDPTTGLRKALAETMQALLR